MATIDRQWLLRTSWILWPAFIAACAAQMVFFAFIDPTDLRIHGAALDLTREAIYGIVFFLFWLLGCCSSALTVFLAVPPLEINHCPPPTEARPKDLPKHEPGDTN